MPSDASNPARQWPLQVAQVLLLALLSVLLGALYETMRNPSSLLGQWFLCVTHLLICGALFLWSRQVARTRQGWRKPVSRIGYMTLGLFVYAVPLLAVLADVYTVPCGGWGPAERAMKAISAPFIVLSIPAWWLLAVTASVLPVLASLLPKVRFHLPTLLLATALLGSMAGINCQLRWACTFSLPCECYGWPIPFYFYGGRGLGGPPVGFEAGMLAANAFLWGVMTVPPILACEWWCRTKARDCTNSPPRRYGSQA